MPLTLTSGNLFVVSTGARSAQPSRCKEKTFGVQQVLESPYSSKVSAKFAAQIPVSNERRATSCRVAADNEQKSASDPSVLQGQNLMLESCTSASRHFVRAIFRPTIANNFIAHKIVRRLSLTVYKSSTSTVETASSRIHLPSTNEYVELACHSQEGKDAFVVYRFFVVKQGRFDLLFGTGSVLR